MTGERAVLVGAWALAAVALFASLGEWVGAVPTLPLETAQAKQPIAPWAPVDSASASNAGTLFVNRNPFRLDRQRANVNFSPDPAPPVPQGPVNPLTRPEPVLVGLLGGPPWQAIVEGIPRTPGGVVLTVGHEAGGVRLDSVRGDTAFVFASDTTWALTPRRPWR